jgi:hypothetical protein
MKTTLEQAERVLLVLGMRPSPARVRLARTMLLVLARAASRL